MNRAEYIKQSLFHWKKKKKKDKMARRRRRRGVWEEKKKEKEKEKKKEIKIWHNETFELVVYQHMYSTSW